MAGVASPSQAFTFPSSSNDEVDGSELIPHFGRMDDSKDFDASFSFPARPSISSPPDRRQSHASTSTPHMTPVLRNEDSTSQQASMHSQLHTFSFPSSAPVNPASRPATIGTLSNPATPTRGGRGHRRTNSDFISGDVGLGVSLRARHASVDAGFGSAVGPTQPSDPIHRPPVSLGHRRKSSLATTPLRQSSLSNDIEKDTIHTGDGGEKSHVDQQETPRATQTRSAEGMPGRGHGRTLSSGFTPTQRAIPRARVGFADRVDFIPRPLSTISSQSGSSMSTVRHSVSASTASAFNSPLRALDHSPSPPAAMNDDFTFPAQPQLTQASATSASFERSEVERSVSAQPSMDNSTSSHTAHSIPTFPGGPNTTPTKPKRKIGSWIHRGRHAKSTLPPHVNAQQLNAPLIQEPPCESPTEQTAPLDIVPRSSAPVELSYDFDADPTMVLSVPVKTILSTSAPEAPISSPSARAEHKADDAELIDLDLATDFGRPSPYKTPKGRSFNAARKSMHSGSAGHRRVESAPSHIFFDPEQYRTAHNTSTSGQSFEMEDVFEEEDEIKAVQSSGLGSSTDASATTSFEADRLSIPSMQRPSSSQNERPRIKFDEANRRLQFKRNSVGGYPRRHSPGLAPVRPATSHAEAGNIPSITLPPVVQLPERIDISKNVVDQGILKQKDSVISRPAYPATEASSSVSSPYAPSQNDFDRQHRGSTTTMATSIVESGKAASIASGEPGPDIRNSQDVSSPLGPTITAPSATVPSRTPLQALHLNSRPLGMRSVSSTMSLASKMSGEPSARRKRSSLGSLGRLLGGADRSAVSLAPVTTINEPMTPRKTNRLSRVLKFWKAKPSLA